MLHRSRAAVRVTRPDRHDANLRRHRHFFERHPAEGAFHRFERNEHPGSHQKKNRPILQRWSGVRDCIPSADTIRMHHRSCNSPKRGYGHPRLTAADELCNLDSVSFGLVVVMFSHDPHEATSAALTLHHRPTQEIRPRRQTESAPAHGIRGKWLGNRWPEMGIELAGPAAPMPTFLILSFAPMRAVRGAVTAFRVPRSDEQLPAFGARTDTVLGKPRHSVPA